MGGTRTATDAIASGRVHSADNERNARQSTRAPLEEGPCKGRRAAFAPAEVESVKGIRTRLIEEGLGDRPIARIAAKEVGRTPDSIERLLRRMVKRGELEPNPNKVRTYSREEDEEILRTREELHAQRIADRRMAPAIGKRIGRGAGSVERRIQRFVADGALPPNTSQRDRWRDEEARLSSMRECLIPKGMKDAEVAKVLSEEFGICQGSAADKMNRMVKRGALPVNPNRKRDYGDEEDAVIADERERGIAQGLQDEAIARAISHMIDRSPGSVKKRMAKLVSQGILEPNPNKKGFPRRMVQSMKAWREELIPMGMNDHTIAGVVADRLGRTRKSVEHKISSLVSRKLLPENPNKQKANAWEARWMIRRRTELMSLGLRDASIIRILAAENDRRNANGVGSVMAQLKRAGILQKNSNKGNREVEEVILEREGFIGKGKSDGWIARQMARSKGRRLDTMKLLIYMIVKRGGCRINPNFRRRKR